MNYQYSYLLLDIGYLVLWFALFFWKKHLRKEMVVISLPFGLLGLALNFLYVKDWWMPLTITGTIPAIEDFIYGFGLGGIAAVIAESFRKKDLSFGKIAEKKKSRRLKFYWASTILCIALFYFLYFVLNINTFYTSILIIAIVMGSIYFFRKDLIKHSVLAGLLVVAVNMILYTVVELITPGFVDAFFYFDFFPKIILFNVPIEDIIFYFFFGAGVGPLYEFWQEGRLKK